MSTSAGWRQFRYASHAGDTSSATLLRWFFCLSAVGAAYGITLELERLGRDGPHLFIFLAAISLCACHGGPRLLLIASVLSVLGAVQLLAPTARGLESTMLPLFTGAVLVLNHSALKRQRLEQGIAGERDWLAAQLELKTAELERMRDVAMTAARKRASLEHDRQAAHDELTRLLRTTNAAELAAALAHEINQPITGVTTQCAAAIKWLDRAPADIEEALNSVHAAERCAARTAAMVEGLRNAITGKPVGTDLVDVNEVVLSAIERSKHATALGHESIRCHLGKDLPRIRGSYIALELVVLNLIANAVEAMEGREHDGLEFLTSLEDDDVCLEVADTGPGISGGNEMFRPFYSTKTTGLGMGLTICRAVVLGHRGTIACKNGEHGGAIFAIRIPAGVCGDEFERGDGLRH